MAALGSEILSISAHQLLVASTGVIGVQLPFERLQKQAGALKEGLRPEAIGDVAKGHYDHRHRP
jgi:N-acetylglutamate synthase/N-acetylornithine aminotransferase